MFAQWNLSDAQGEMGGYRFCVDSQSKNAEAASLFVLWLNSQKDSLVQLYDKNQLPILVSKVVVGNHHDLFPGGLLY